MRRKLALLLGFAFALALLRLLRRHREPAPLAQPQSPEQVSPYAEELRRKLAESRADEAGPAEAPPEPEDEQTIERERQRVHDQARSVLDEMRAAETRSS